MSMIFTIGKKRAEIDESSIALFWEGRELHRQSTASLLTCSVSRPWSAESQPWTVTEKRRDENSLTLSLDSKNVRAELTFGAEEDGLKLDVSFVNMGEEELTDFTAGLTIPVCREEKCKTTIPHLIYNDNPSADPERIVPHIGKMPGRGIVVEEHRLPIPAVNVEWKQEGGYPFLTLLLKPRVTDGDIRNYWSLGALKQEKGVMVTSLSGPLMFNGIKDVVYGGRCTPLSYPCGYRYLRAGERLCKTYYLGWGQNEEEGRGFKSLVTMGLRILKPETVPVHTHEEMIAYKRRVLDSRYYEGEGRNGYLTFGACNGFGNISGRPEFFLYGWTGQSIRLAWCDIMLGLLGQDESRISRGTASADFFVSNGESRIRGLFYGYYVLEEDKWKGAWNNENAGLSSRIQGESLSDLLDVMLLLRGHGRQVPDVWEGAVKRACAFLMDPSYQTPEGIYPLEWEQDGSIKDESVNAAGVPCVLALAKAYEYFGDRAHLDYSIAKYVIYSDIHMKTFEIPFARATMDARCEDKEAGLSFFTAAVKLWQLTKEKRFMDWAALAGDWILTFVFMWETGFMKGSQCAKKGFHTTGWPGVSVQNHHLDVFFPVYEMYEFGRQSGIERFERMAVNVRNALTYGVCTEEGEWGYTVIGEQGEQYYQTNYFQLRYPQVLEYMSGWRGGMQVWNPSWITAQVLSSELKFWKKGALEKQ